MSHLSRLTLMLAVSQSLFFSADRLVAADPSKISLIIADNAPALEKFATEELSQQFQKLWSAETTIAAKPQASADGVILIGSPETNPAVKAAIGKAWPKLSDQGIVVKSVKSNTGTSLVVGGGSPVATLWAAYELGHQFGIRYHLAGDDYKADPPE
jgi:hypothetical protein